MSIKWQNNGAGPIQIKRFNDACSKVRWENNTFVELYGVIGVNESKSVLSNVFGTNVREDVSAVQEKIGDRYSWTLTKENAAEVTEAILAELPALQANRPVVDKRETSEARSERDANLARITAEHDAKAKANNQAFTRLYGNGQTVTVKPGEMAVIAKICYDNSDSMTDYFDRHASLSPAFCLLLVPKQAESERLARRGVAESSLLSGIDFIWHTEKHSMGHGNYLTQNSGFELPAELQGIRNYYRGGGVTHGHWEIQFSRAYGQAIELPAIAGYGQRQDPMPEPTTGTNGVTVSENTDKNGIEIRFPAKPAVEMLERLKANGWRWSRFNQCWYKAASDTARQFAAELTL